MHQRNRGAIVALAVLNACSPADGGLGFSVRDSTGILIAENELAQLAVSDWSLEDQPVLSIGTVDGDSAYAFFRVISIDRLSDGSLLVTQAGPPHLRIFSADGAFVRSIGRVGDGPGEFRSVSSVQVLDADTIMVFDPRNRRISLSDRSGVISESVNLDAASGLLAVHRLPTGRFLTVGSPDGRAQMSLPPGLHRPTRPVVVFSPDGAPEDTIGVFPGLEIQIVAIEGGIGTSAAVWGRTLAVETRGPEIIIGTGESFELMVFEPSHTLTKIIRVVDADLTIQAEAWAEYKRTTLAEIDEVESRAFMQHFLDESTPPSARAPFTRILVDDRGRLWLSPYERTDLVEGSWHVLDTGGRLIARVKAPERFRILDIEAEFATGVWRDELDVEHVRVYRLLDVSK